MWWDDDSWVSRLIPSLLEAEREGELPFVTVIGSTWVEGGERSLFIGVDPALDPRPAEWAPGNRLRDRLARMIFRRYGPLPRFEDGPRPTEPYEEGGVAVYIEPPRFMAAIAQLLAVRLGLSRREWDPLTVPLYAADPETRNLLARFALPAETRIGYLGPIRPLTRKGLSVFRRPVRKSATAGCLVRTDLGLFLTTAGHLGAEKGDLVYRREGLSLFPRNWVEWGRVTATTCPERPDQQASVSGLDIAAVSMDGLPHQMNWDSLEVGDPRDLRREAYICWKGGTTGRHEGTLVVTAAMAKADGDVPYEHALMVLGNPPRRGGRQGDSGSAMYDAEGRLLGHLVGIDGALERGIAPGVWFQMIDVANPYLEMQCGPISHYYGDRGQ